MRSLDLREAAGQTKDVSKSHSDLKVVCLYLKSDQTDLSFEVFVDEHTKEKGNVVILHQKNQTRLRVLFIRSSLCDVKVQKRFLGLSVQFVCSFSGFPELGIK